MFHAGIPAPIEGVILGACIFVLVLLFVGFVILSYKWMNHKQEGSLLPQFKLELGKLYDSSLNSVSMSVLMKATDNFSKERVIGDGGFGLVYKATLPNGRNLAVKRLSMEGVQGKREFEAEMDTLGKIRHHNLVELMAYCKAGDDRVLVYALVENGSLDTWLHEREDGPKVLNWRNRVNIAKGCARGLMFLHHSCDPHVIHRDIKSSNILLDESFEAKIADFGLARLMSPMVSHVTTEVAGTMGYMAPELSSCMISTCKTDVFSFGMVLLELATGKRPNEPVNLRTSLLKWVCQSVEEGNVMDLVDPILRVNAPTNEVIKFFQIAYKCTSEEPRKRPTMQEVTLMLKKIEAKEDIEIP